MWLHPCNSCPHQKTRSGDVKKGDTMRVLKTVNTPFTLEDLIQMIDVSVSSKYGVDLKGITQMLVDSLQGSFELFKLESKRESKEGLSRWVRAVVQQVLREAKGKSEVDIMGAGLATSSTGTTTAQTLHQATMGVGGQGCVTNPNLRQPYYQVQSYGPGTQHVPDLPDSYFPIPSPIPVPMGNTYLGMSENVRGQVV
jgi:hypothetical protein